MVEIAAEIAAAPTQEAKNAIRREYAFLVNANNEQFGPDYIGALPVPPIPDWRLVSNAMCSSKRVTPNSSALTQPSCDLLVAREGSMPGAQASV